MKVNKTVQFFNRALKLCKILRLVFYLQFARKKNSGLPVKGLQLAAVFSAAFAIDKYISQSTESYIGLGRKILVS